MAEGFSTRATQVLVVAVIIDEKHLNGLLGTAGKAIAAMPEGPRVVESLKKARSREDVLFVLQSADLSLADPARKVITDAAREDWRDLQARLLKSAEMQLIERYHANA